MGPDLVDLAQDWDAANAAIASASAWNRPNSPLPAWPPLRIIFQSDKAFEIEMARKINNSHSATPKDLDDFITRYRNANSLLR